MVSVGLQVTWPLTTCVTAYKVWSLHWYAMPVRASPFDHPADRDCTTLSIHHPGPCIALFSSTKSTDSAWGSRALIPPARALGVRASVVRASDARVNVPPALLVDDHTHVLFPEEVRDREPHAHR